MQEKCSQALLSGLGKATCGQILKSLTLSGRQPSSSQADRDSLTVKESRPPRTGLDMYSAAPSHSSALAAPQPSGCSLPLSITNLPLSPKYSQLPTHKYQEHISKPHLRPCSNKATFPQVLNSRDAPRPLAQAFCYGQLMTSWARHRPGPKVTGHRMQVTSNP